MTIEVPRSANGATTARAAGGRVGAGADASGSGAFMLALSAADSASAESPDAAVAAVAVDATDPATPAKPAKPAKRAGDADLRSAEPSPPSPGSAVEPLPTALPPLAPDTVAGLPDPAAPRAAPDDAPLAAVVSMDNSMLLAQSAISGAAAVALAGQGAKPPVDTTAVTPPGVGALAAVASSESAAKAAPLPSAPRSLPQPAAGQAPAEATVPAADASAPPEMLAAMSSSRTAGRTGARTPSGGPTTGETALPQSQAALQRLAVQEAAAQAERQAPLQAAGLSTRSEAIVPQASAEPGMLWRRSERTGERSTGTFSVQGSEPGSGSAARASPLMAPVDAASASAPGVAANFAERMVEQVSWWISQKTQGAELQVEVMGGQTVSVSVQIQGNEAHIAFRSDQADVRQMIGDAMPQLKDMLGGEGLMLSGATVGGHSGASGEAARDEAARAARSGPSGGLAAEPVPALAAPAGSRAPSGRTLDLYV